MRSDLNKPPLSLDKIYLSPPHMGGHEKEFIDYAFETNWIAPMGSNLDGFEQDLCSFVGVKYAVGLSSGTAAIHLALQLAGVGPGDEVVCQSMTFAASANPIVYLGATPVFVDSEEQTWNMDPEHLREVLKSRARSGSNVKAVIVVHLYGMPANMDLIKSVCAEHEVPIIEDAAEALGSRLNGVPCGSMADWGILSFNGNKIITTSGGGALLTNNETHASRARFLATQARDPEVHYQHSSIGYNYRLSNVLAGIGRGQMVVLDDRVASRRGNFDCYRSHLKDMPGLQFHQEPEGYFSNRWLTTILIDPVKSGGVTVNRVRHELERVGIESRPLWKPMHLQPVFRDAPYSGGEVSERLFRDGLCLPSGSSLTQSDLERVIDTVRSCWQ